MSHPKAINYISYLRDNGTREKTYADKSTGKFELQKYTRGSAYEFCEQEKVKHSDPTLNLNDGDKVRVYMGGDPSLYTAYALATIERHQSLFQPKRSEQDTEPTRPADPADPYSFDWKTFYSD